MSSFIIKTSQFCFKFKKISIYHCCRCMTTTSSYKIFLCRIQLCKSKTHLYMSPEVAFLSKRRWTEVANVRLLSRVFGHMNLQSTFLIECPVTSGALKWPFTLKMKKYNTITETFSIS